MFTHSCQRSYKKEHSSNSDRLRRREEKRRLLNQFSLLSSHSQAAAAYRLKCITPTYVYIQCNSICPCKRHERIIFAHANATIAHTLESHKVTARCVRCIRHLDASQLTPIDLCQGPDPGRTPWWAEDRPRAIRSKDLDHRWRNHLSTCKRTHTPSLSSSLSLSFLHTHRARSTHARRVISPVVWSGSRLPGRGANNNRGEQIDSRCSTFSWFPPVRAQLMIERGRGFKQVSWKK